MSTRPPEGACIIRADGSREPLELFYAGRDAEGLHVWEATQAVHLLPGDHVHLDKLPGRTTVRFRGPDDPPEAGPRE